MFPSLRRLLLSYAVIVPLLIGCSDVAARFYLPLFTTVFNANYPNYELISLSLVEADFDKSFQATVRISPQGPLAQYGLPAGTEASSRTLLAYVLVYPAIILSLIVAWPRIAWQARVFICLLSSTIIVIVTSVEIPAVLAASLDELLLSNRAQRPSGYSLSQTWLYLSANGGRYAVSLFVGFLLLGVAQWLAEPASHTPH